MNLNLYLMITATLGLAFTATGTVSAADQKVFPGALCRQTGSSSVVSYDTNGRVHNATAGTVSLVCPIVRDVTTSKWNSVSVVVADRSYTSNVVCRAWSAQTDGLGWFQTSSSTGANPEWYVSQTLTFNAQGEERDNGTYYLECTVPAQYEGNNSGVLSYRIDEP
ncbi:hypothetical protein WMF18_36755 [Sorangium sp. So ce315]|uniref:hypothetical protein n=1 Tax=Sorangium sp. So ce315 TaxID=3133299 RepID=UPI003F622C15